MNAALELTNITKSYPKPTGGQVVIVENFNLAIRPGEFVCLIGHSGCGKSTIISMVAGLLPATTGTMRLDGQP